MKVISTHWPLSVALSLACDLPDVSDEGRHVRIAADPGLHLCAGSLAHMDEFVHRLSAEFGILPPIDDDRILYYWLDPDDFSTRSSCSQGPDGCEREGTVYARVAPLNHELVHAVTHRVGHPPPFFVEGLATAYGGLGSIRQASMNLAPDVMATIEAPNSRSVDYVAAGAFTSFLVMKYGVDAYLKLYTALPSDAKAREVDVVFRAMLGVPLDESVRNFEEAFGACSQAESDAKVVECAAPELPWDGPRMTLYRRVSCDQEDALGPYEKDHVVVLYTVVIPETGLYEIKVVTERADGPPVAITLVPCGWCGSGPSVTASSSAGHVTTKLHAGRHSMRLLRTSSAATSMGFSLLRIGPPMPAGL